MDFIKTIITNPWYSILTILALWFIIYKGLQLFIHSEIIWKRLEIVYILTGALGIIGIVNNNMIEVQKYKVRNIDMTLKLDISNLKFYLNNSCFKYQKSEFSPEDLEYRQIDQDNICSWAQNFKIDSVNNFTKPIDTLSIKAIVLYTDEMAHFKMEFSKLANKINSDIAEYNDLSSRIRSNEWESWLRSLGVLFLIFALSLRLSISSHNIYMQKRLRREQKKIEPEIKNI